MKRKAGYTLAELLICIVISSMVILTIGVIAGISRNSYQRIRTEADVFNDIAYGFKLIQNRVRKAQNLSIVSTSGEWKSDRLIINNKYAFGLYQANASDKKDFVFLPNKDDATVREVIFSVPNNDTLNLEINLSNQSVGIRIYGIRSKVPFDLSTSVTRRG